MRIPCPFCGERDAREFSYLGDASGTRPDPAAADAERLFFEYVYLRDNPAGAHAEFWYHAQGCRSWLKVCRDTVSHHVEGAVLAAGRDR
jgi:methylglutamate dehydrogenase subunit B